MPAEALSYNNDGVRRILVQRVGMNRRIRLYCVGWLAVLLLTVLLPSAPAVRADDPPAKAVVGVNIGNESPTPAKWLDRVAEFFRLPIVNVALIALGMIGLIFEFKFPGTTFPGSVAAICFVLFFWAYSFVGAVHAAGDPVIPARPGLFGHRGLSSSPASASAASPARP